MTLDMQGNAFSEPPFASTSWSAAASSTAATAAVAGPLRRPTVCIGGSTPSGESFRSSSHSRSKRSSGSGDNNAARFDFNRSLRGFSIGAGGGAAAWCGGATGARASPLWPLREPRSPPIDPKDRRPRVLILMSDTGGGHRASAEALRAGFRSLFGDRHRIDVVDLWTHHTPWPFNQLPKSYSFMVHHPWIWRANFTMTQPRFVHLPLATLAAAITGRRISAMYDKYKPNLVISVHPLMQHVPVRVLRRRVAAGLQDDSTAFATVVTDLTTCHNTWFYPGVDRCYVATEETRHQALSMGLQQDQIRVYGLPIRPAFAQKTAPKRTLRRRLGMDKDKPAVLLVGGGEGMGPVERTVDALASVVGADCQIVVVCGRNARLVQRLSSKAYPGGMHVLVKGFVDNMPELMCACDAIITKAGPGTISEALICGLPLVLNAYVPCQEEGNIPYVTDNHVGVFEADPTRAAKVIQSWLAGGEGTLRRLAARAKALSKPDALFDIVRDLETLIGSKNVAARNTASIADVGAVAAPA